MLDLLGEPRHRDHVAVREGCPAALFAGDLSGGGFAGGGHVDADAFVAGVSFDDAAVFDGEGVGVTAPETTTSPSPQRSEEHHV